MAVWSQVQSPLAADLAYGLVCTPALSVTQQRRAAAACGDKCYAFIFTFYFSAIFLIQRRFILRSVRSPLTPRISAFKSPSNVLTPQPPAIYHAHFA